MDRYKIKLLREIDRLTTLEEKVIYLNKEFLKANTTRKENTILEILEKLKQWG